MKDILMNKTGAAEDILLLAEITEPDIKSASEVKIKINAASVNPIEIKV